MGGLALVGGTVGAECAEGGGVGAAFGGEVAAEAEHVGPCGQVQVFEFGELGQAQAFGDVAAGVVANGQQSELVGWGDAAVEGAGAFGGLGGVLGDVRGDLGVGEVPGGGDRAGVEFAAPGQSPGGQSAGGWGLDVDGAGGPDDGVGEQAEGGPGGRGGGWPVGAVEADDRVEVDDPAALVFGDLGVGEPEPGR